MKAPRPPRRLKEIGTLTTVVDGAAMPDDQRAALIRQYPVLLTCWGAAPIPLAIATGPGGADEWLEVTCTDASGAPEPSRIDGSLSRVRVRVAPPSLAKVGDK